MSNPIRSYDYRGCEIQVDQDEDPVNPRTEFDNLTVMACFHKRYDLGDTRHNFKSEHYSGWDDMKAAIIRVEKPAVILPLYLYDHSGLTIRTTPFECHWDSGQIGFVWMTKIQACKNWSWKKLTAARLKQVTDFILAEVKVYDDYLRGDVYAVSALSEDDEYIHSCGGYDSDAVSGLDAYAIVEARSHIDDHLETRGSQYAVS